MRPGGLTNAVRVGEPYKGREISQAILIRTTHACVVDVGKPLDGGRYRRQLLKFDPRQTPLPSLP